MAQLEKYTYREYPTSEKLNKMVDAVNSSYQKPSDGIPKTDLDSDVQNSLNKANSAIQQHQSLAGYAKTSDIPTKLSQLTNDIISTGDAYTKEESDGKFAVKEEVGDLSKLETKEKSDLVSAINEAATKGGVKTVNGKEPDTDGNVSVQEFTDEYKNKLNRLDGNQTTVEDIKNILEEIGDSGNLNAVTAIKLQRISNIVNVAEDGFFVVDSEHNIGLRLDNNGLKAVGLLNYKITEEV